MSVICLTDASKVGYKRVKKLYNVVHRMRTSFSGFPSQEKRVEELDGEKRAKELDGEKRAEELGGEKGA